MTILRETRVHAHSWQDGHEKIWPSKRCKTVLKMANQKLGHLARIYINTHSPVKMAKIKKRLTGVAIFIGILSTVAKTKHERKKT